MKNLFLFLSCALIACQISAQAKFGLKAGLNYSKFKYELGEYSKSQGAKDPNYKFSSIPGFQGGFTILAPLSENVGLKTELLLSFRNVELNDNVVEIDYINQRSTENGYVSKDKTGYLEIPLNVYYGIPLGSHQVQLYMGFTMAIGLFGSQSYAGWVNVTDLTTGVVTTKNVIEGEDDIAFHYIPSDPSERTENTIYRNPLDFSINIGASVLLSEHFLFSLQYSKGLSNAIAFQEEYISYNRKDEDRLEYRNIALSLAYLF